MVCLSFSNLTLLGVEAGLAWMSRLVALSFRCLFIELEPNDLLRVRRRSHGD
jgi:hypothetical protein